MLHGMRTITGKHLPINDTITMLIRVIAGMHDGRACWIEEQTCTVKK